MSRPLTTDVWVMALPGPDHLPHSLAAARRFDLRTRPQELYQQICDALERGLAMGLTQVLLPPPWPHWHTAEGDPEWQELCQRSPEVDTQAWATVIAGGDTEHGDTVVMLANRAAERAGQWLPYRQRCLQALLSGVPQLRLLPALPAAPQLADCGEASHLRVDNGAESAQVFGYSEGLLLPEDWRGRQAGWQARGAQLALLRRAEVRPGRSLVARQHWRALDAAALSLRDLVCGHGATWILHESSFGEQHDLINALDALVPGLRLHIVRDGEYRLKDHRQAPGLGGTMLRDAAGAYHLLIDPRWEDRRAQRLRARLLDAGTVESIREDLDPRLLGLRRSGSWRLCLPLLPAQIAALPAPWLVTPELISALRCWAEAQTLSELGLEQRAAPETWEGLYAARQGLEELLPGLPPEDENDRNFL
ncbi:MAG: hypothetical protein EA402_12625 [Planctomycetota bacterium]|nr:MAG: hypothetical protein EA402_12625 [Planctomycetota bacterium]